jgi:outer membrane protein with beta-barrel domain
MAHRKYALGLCAGLALCAVSARAQTPTPGTEKFFLNANVGGQLATRTIKAAASKEVFQETATVSSDQPIGRGVVIDFDGGYRVRQDFFAGVLVSFFGTSSTAATTASIPDQVFFNRPKIVSGSTDGLKRREVAVAPHITYARPLTDNFDITLSGGIAFIHLSQDLVGDFEVTPPQTLTIKTTSDSASGVGPFAQVDVIYNLKPRYGVGGYVRYAGAKVDLPTSADANVGGMQAGGGIRLRF